MTLLEAIQARHSERKYIDKPIEESLVRILQDKVNEVNAERTFSLICYTKMDLGIAKYHFEIGAGKENFEWA